LAGNIGHISRPGKGSVFAPSRNPHRLLTGSSSLFAHAAARSPSIGERSLCSVGGPMKTVDRLVASCLCAALAVMLAAGPLRAQEPAPSLSAADVGAFTDSFFARYLRESPDPSLAVAVVAGDSVLVLKGYGSEDGKRPVDP